MKSIKIPMMLMTLLASYSLSAQTKIGLTAGASFANITVKAEGISGSPKEKTGFTAGILLNAPLSTNFSFQPALNFVQKGYIVKDETGTEKVMLNYLEVPLNFVYNTQKNEGFFIGAGPSISYGISGRDKFTYSGSGMPPTSEKVKFGKDGEEVKPFDVGANIMAGYLFMGGFMISGNYNFGLSKINNDDDSGGNGTIRNRYFAIKVGYVFGGNKKK